MGLQAKETKEQKLEEHKKRREMFKLLMEQQDLIITRIEKEIKNGTNKNSCFSNIFNR